MAKLLLISVILMMIVVPAIAARDPNPRRGLKRAVIWFVGYNFFYLLAVRYLYYRLL
jgi:hypothetical protein